MMRALIAQPGRRLAVWLLAFFSPTLYLLLLPLAGRSELVGQFGSVVVGLFCLVPVVALLVCEYVVWWSRMTVAWKVAAMLFTLVAMLIQVGILVVIIRAILIAAIGYAQ